MKSEKEDYQKSLSFTHGITILTTPLTCCKTYIPIV